MKKGLSGICMLLDKSGSMGSISNDIIGGFNEFIKKQKELPGDCNVSLYQFDEIYETLFERIKLQNVKDLTTNDYSPRGSTALYDAMGKTINNYGEYLSSLNEDERPDRVLIVIVTDGLDNASKQFNLEKVRELVTQQRKDYNWDFVFLGSNIDSWQQAGQMGTSQGSTLQFANVSGSVCNAFSSLSSNTRAYRCAPAKMAFAFTKEDYNDQDQFLSGEIKIKNKNAAKNVTK